MNTNNSKIRAPILKKHETHMHTVLVRSPWRHGILRGCCCCWCFCWSYSCCVQCAVCRVWCAVCYTTHGAHTLYSTHSSHHTHGTSHGTTHTAQHTAQHRGQNTVSLFSKSNQLKQQHGATPRASASTHSLSNKMEHIHSLPGMYPTQGAVRRLHKFALTQNW